MDRAYRYTGISGRAEIDGRVLEHGDVVLLNENQARNFADRFSVEQPVTN